MQRTDKRKNDQLRDVSITPDFNMHAEGSALIKFGNTHVVCNATIEKATPGGSLFNGRIAYHMCVTKFN